MPVEEISPRKVQETVKLGFDRVKTYRSIRAMLIKEYVGQYYRDEKGVAGDEPINLIFNAIRSIVPNLVMVNPVNRVTTTFFQQKQYAELLSLALDQLQQEIKFKNSLRGWIVSALFSLGIMKTGIAASGQMIQISDINIDPGQIYSSLVDLDDFTIDPVCEDLNEVSFLGNIVTVPRQYLLDLDLYDSDLVKQLPGSNTNASVSDDIKNLTQTVMAATQVKNLQDMVDIVELWVPGADAIVTIPDPRQQVKFDKYIGINDYYGPKEGPYSFLSFTPPVPKNPLPVAPVSIWYDLHLVANRMFKKMVNQAERQKDIVLYNPAQADEAQDIADSYDGDYIASSDPKGINTVSLGGQNPHNEIMLQQLQIWFNYMAGNPDQLSGQKSPSGGQSSTTATQASILQSNAAISIEDAREIIYDATSEVGRKQAWYLHTDPLINMPLTKRDPSKGEIQVWLTPEQRQGDFLRLAFNIKPRSMSRVDPMTLSRTILDFATNIVPGLVQSANMSMSMGVPFNLQRAITMVAERLGISDEVQEWFEDPEYAQKLQLMMLLGPQNPGKASLTPEGVQQNKGFPGKRDVPDEQKQFNQQSQRVAGEAQSDMMSGAY